MDTKGMRREYINYVPDNEKISFANNNHLSRIAI